MTDYANPFRPLDGERLVVYEKFLIGDRVKLIDQEKIGTVKSITGVDDTALVRVEWDSEVMSRRTMPQTFSTVPVSLLCHADE